MNSEKLSTIDGILFELHTLRKAEDEVRLQISQVVRYTPIWFSIIFIFSRIVNLLILPLLLFCIGFFIWVKYEIKLTVKRPLMVQSNSLFCQIPEYNLRSPSLIPTDPNDQATTIGGTITTFPWSAWDEGLTERLSELNSK